MDTLPTELLQQIIFHLAPADIAHLTQAQKRLHSVATECLYEKYDLATPAMKMNFAQSNSQRSFMKNASYVR